MNYSVISPLYKFYDYFGANALLFTAIKKWDLSYVVLDSALTVSIDCAIKSTKTSQTLWSYNGQVIDELDGGNSGGNSLGGFIIKAMVPATLTASADYVHHARTATHRTMVALPYGRYHAL